MNHAKHVPGTVAECGECQKVALEPGWYKLLSGLTEAGDSEPEVEDEQAQAEIDLTGAGKATEIDLSKVEAERAKTRIDLSDPDEGKPVVDLPESEEKKRTAAQRKPRK